MTTLAISTYLPAGDLAKIIAAVLIVAVIAPSAVSIAVVGLDRRATGSPQVGARLVALGVGVLAALVALGLYALVNR
jgi:hypothetical protein